VIWCLNWAYEMKESSCAGDVARMEKKRNVYNRFVRKPDEKKTTSKT
jgi:hypothetical protein